jgi:DNA repair exonuclease SbcCD nuclease subunit
LSKYLIINDVHLTNDNSHPSSCTPSYTPDLFNLLKQAADLAVVRECEAIIQLGDFFHIKTPSRNSHELVQRAMRWARDCVVPVFIVPGNHDLLNDRLDSLDEGQPLGVLYDAGVAQRAEGYLHIKGPRGPFDSSVQALPIFGIGWQQYWDAQADIADRAVAKALEGFEPEDTPQLIVTHAPFFPPGANPAYEHYSTEKFARMVNPTGKANVQVIYGHIHDYHGEYVVNGVRFANYGALSRGSLTESNLTRPVGVTIWDAITGRFEFIELQAKPADQVFRVKEITEVRTTQLKLDEFLKSVGQSTIEITTTESVLSKVRSLKLGKEIERIVEELLTSVG